MHQFFPDADPEPEIYELLSWDLPGQRKHHIVRGKGHRYQSRAPVVVLGRLISDS